MQALSLNELQNLSDDELVRRHDEQAKTTGVGVDYCLDEINRRHQERQTASMLGFTKWITFMTVVVTVATLANVVLATVNLVRQ